MQRDTQQGLTRREALKRGAAIAGGLAWATPLVQAVGMRPAFAQIPSPVPKDCCHDADGDQLKLATLTMKYLGGENFCSPVGNPPAWLSCTDTPTPPSALNLLLDPAHIVASHQENIFDSAGNVDTNKRIWFNSANPLHSPGPIPAGGTFVIDAVNALESELKGETWIHIFAGLPSPANYRQEISMHTSCSVDLFTGDRFGSVEVVDCTPPLPKKTASESLTEEPAGTETDGLVTEPAGEELTGTDTGGSTEPVDESAGG